MHCAPTHRTRPPPRPLQERLACGVLPPVQFAAHQGLQALAQRGMVSFEVAALLENHVIVQVSLLDALFSTDEPPPEVRPAERGPPRCAGVRPRHPGIDSRIEPLFSFLSLRPCRRCRSTPTS
jgi:hypothetical protein